jgi:hypothetical protein
MWNWSAGKEAGCHSFGAGQCSFVRGVAERYDDNVSDEGVVSRGRPINALSAVAVGVLFDHQFEQVVVEFRGEVWNFGEGDEAWSMF